MKKSVLVAIGVSLIVLVLGVAVVILKNCYHTSSRLESIELTAKEAGKKLRDMAREGNLGLVKKLLTRTDIHEVDILNAASMAAAHGYLEVLKQFPLSAKADLASICLEAAAGNGHMEIVTYILKTRPEMTAEEVGLALNTAVIGGQLEAVKYLLKVKPAIRAEDVGRALGYAASFGTLDILEYLIQTRRDIRPEDIKQALEMATKNGHTKVVEYLKKQQK